MAFAGSLGLGARFITRRVAGQRLTARPICIASHVHSRTLTMFSQHPVRLNGRRPMLLFLTSRNITQNASGVQATTNTPNKEQALSTSSGVSVPPDASPVDASTEVLPGFADTVTTHFPAALQYGDLAALGLVSWTPAGLVRWSLEIVNVATGLPWFWTIVAGSLLWRALLLPISIKAVRNSARLQPIQPQIVNIQKEMERVRQTGDKLGMQRTALKLRKVYKDNGVSLGATALVPFIQIPVTLGLFFGVKTMCDLPLAQLTYSGLDLLPNLTVPDPYMVLPVLLCAAVNAQISVGAAEMNLNERPEMGHMMNGLRLLSVLGVWVMSAFPSGLMVSLLTTSLATTTQSWLLQRPRIRAALDIPLVPVTARGRLPGPKQTVEFVISKWRSKMEEAKAQATKQQKSRRR